MDARKTQDWKSNQSGAGSRRKGKRPGLHSSEGGEGTEPGAPVGRHGRRRPCTLTCLASAWVTDKLEHVVSRSGWEPAAELAKLSRHSWRTTSLEEA